jgi:hypothetical protein
VFVVGGKAGQLVHRKALAHVPVAVPVAVAIPVGGRGGVNLEEDLSLMDLSRPRAVNIGLRSRGRGERREGEYG